VPSHASTAPTLRESLHPQHPQQEWRLRRHRRPGLPRRASAASSQPSSRFLIAAADAPAKVAETQVPSQARRRCARGEDSSFPIARLDDMIRRRLVAAFRIGVFEHPAKRVEADVSTPSAAAAAIEVITGGAVLLKNDRNILPIGPKRQVDRDHRRPGRVCPSS